MVFVKECLAKQPSRPTIPVDFSIINTRFLAREFGVKQETVLKYMHGLGELKGQEVRLDGLGKGSKYYATADTILLLRESLRKIQPRGKATKKAHFRDSERQESQVAAQPEKGSSSSLRETIPFYSTLNRKIQLAIDCLDRLKATLAEKETLLITFLWQEDASVVAREETARILGMRPEEVHATIHKSPSLEEEQRMEVLYRKFLEIKKSFYV